MRYVKAVNTGKGFITHADQPALSFSGKPNNMWEVDGPTSEVDAWITRISGVEKTQQESEDNQFKVTKFRYTGRNMLANVLTPAEVEALLTDYHTNVAIRNFFSKFIDDNNVNVSAQPFVTNINNLKNKGYFSQARVDEIVAGRINS